MQPQELKSIPLFASLGKDELALVARQADEVDVGAGKVLATEGRFAYEFFVIADGAAEVTREGAALRTLGPGDFFGEIGVLESERRTASVRATTPMRLVVLTAQGLKGIERQMPAVAERIREAASRRLAADAAAPAPVPAPVP
jgi:CRP-like cAMP-binding protein